MVSCCAYGCKNSPANRPKGVTFHRFPRNPIRRLQWIKAVRRKNFAPSSISVVCSEHFSEDQIDRTSLSVVRLRENAVPSFFEAFPTHLRNALKDREPHANSGSTQNHSTPTILRLVTSPDIPPTASSVDNAQGVSQLEEIPSDSASEDIVKNSDIPTVDAQSRFESFSCLQEVSISLSNASVQVEEEDFFLQLTKPASSSCRMSVGVQAQIGMSIEEQNRIFRNLRGQICMYRKKIKTLQQSNRRLQKRVRDFKSCHRISHEEEFQTENNDDFEWEEEEFETLPVKYHAIVLSQ